MKKKTLAFLTIPVALTLLAGGMVGGFVATSQSQPIKNKNNGLYVTVRFCDEPGVTYVKGRRVVKAVSGCKWAQVEKPEVHKYSEDGEAKFKGWTNNKATNALIDLNATDWANVSNDGAVNIWPVFVGPDFETDSWEKVIKYAEQGIEALHQHYSENCANNEDFPGTLIGLERTVNVNSVDHRVRVVDENHDAIFDNDNDPTNDKNAALTFEFANLVSDSNGWALTSFWQDTATLSTANFDYLNSTIRYNLTEQGNGGSGHYKDSTKTTTYNGTQWYGCDADGNSEKTHKSELENTSVLDMIQTGEPELYNALKPTKQYVATTTDGWTTYDVTTDDEYHDKVFLPPAYCYGYKDEYMFETKPTPYKYYEYENEQADKDGGRLKHAVGVNDDNVKKSEVSITDRLYSSAYNCAGYTLKNKNSKYTKEHLGTYYWLSSPVAYDWYGSYGAWNVDYSGGVIDGVYGVCTGALAVAPAFCI